MAKAGDNIVTAGLGGKLGNLIVFRNLSGKTYVAKAPKKKCKIILPGIYTLFDIAFS